VLLAEKPFRDARSLLISLIVTFGILTAVAFVSLAFAQGFWQSLVSSIGSACLSIVLALSVTEVVLKPVFARDVVRLAQLKQRVADIGLVELGAESSIPWDDEYSNATEILVAVVNPKYWIQRDLNRLLTAASSSNVAVNVCFPEPGPISESVARGRGIDSEQYKLEIESVALDLENAWREKKGIRRGSSLQIDWVTAPLAGFFLASNHTYISATDGAVASYAAQPLYLAVGRQGNSDVHRWLEQVREAIRSSRSVVPVWASPGVGEAK